MKIPTRQLRNGFQMPVFGLGTWQMGGRHEPDHSLDNKDIFAIKSAVEMGVTHIDTAESYANGHTEELVGQAIKDFDRSKLLLVSKVSGWNQSYRDLLKSAENSLKRLGTDYLDLYLLHQHNREIPLKETMKAMDELVKQNMVRNIGVSNFTKESLSDAQNNTSNKVVTNQVYYSLKNREPEKSGLLTYCQKEDVLLTAYRPTEKGFLVNNNFPILDEMAVKYKKTPAQIAINWLISQDHVTVLVKSSNLDHLKENLGSFGWEISSTDTETLRNNFPSQVDVSDNLPLG